MIGRWRAFPAVAALVMDFLDCSGIGLASAHPVGSTHHPGVAVLALVAKGTDATVDSRLLMVWGPASREVHLSAVMGVSPELALAVGMALLFE